MKICPQWPDLEVVMEVVVPALYLRSGQKACVHLDGLPLPGISKPKMREKGTRPKDTGLGSRERSLCTRSLKNDDPDAETQQVITDLVESGQGGTLLPTVAVTFRLPL